MTTIALENPEAELAVLGSVLLDGAEVLALVRPHLPVPGAFASAVHATLYAAILATCDAGHPIEPVSVRTTLAGRGVTNADQVIEQAVDAAITSAHVEHHARLVRETWRRRQADAEAARLRSALADPEVPVELALSRIVERLAAQQRPVEAARPTMAGALHTVLTHLEHLARTERETVGVPSGFAGLDALTDGWRPGKLIIVAARPSEGKTALGLQFATAAVSQPDADPVEYVSLEMGRDELLERLLSAEAGINLKRLRNGRVFDAEFPKLSRASQALSSRANLGIEEHATTPAMIRLHAQCQAALAPRGRLGLLVVDYLQLMSAGVATTNRDREIGEITKALKRLARDLQIPVLLLSQLTRANARENRPPELYDLRDSGNIEQDADQVLMVHWPDGKNPKGPTAMDLYVRKNRDGATGKVLLAFETWTGRLWEVGNRELAA
jgi:replicative DNA helicase